MLYITVKHLRAWTLALAIAASLLQLTPALRAQPQTARQGAQENLQRERAFFGQIVKARDGRFALLTDKIDRRGFYLDDHGKAEKFLGKDVELRGTLDMRAKVIDVMVIENAKSQVSSYIL